MKIKTLKLADSNFYQSLKNALSFDEEDNSQIQQTVKDIVQAVKVNGDQALLEFTKKFDKVDLDNPSDLELPSNILKEAYEAGTIMCGVSAGAICWLEYGITDSWKDELKIINCLGFVPGGCCPHYDEEPKRKPSLKKFLNEGALENCNAIDGGCALHIKDGVENKAIVFDQNKNAYLVKKNGEEIRESPYLREKIF